MAILLSLTLWSCSSEDQRAQESAVESTGRLSVRIIPDGPTVETDLVAVISGPARKAAYRWEVNGKAVSGLLGEKLEAGPFMKGDEVAVTVDSGDGISTSKVLIKNAPPSVSSASLAPEIIYRGVNITANVEGHDPDGDYLRYDYTWIINGEELHTGSEPVLKGELFRRGDRIALKVIPSDGETEGEAFVSMPVIIPNAPPVFISTPPASFKARIYSYRVLAEDPDGDALSYSLSKAPGGMTIDNEGLITWPIKEGDGGTHGVEVVVEDGLGAKATQSYEVAIALSEG